MAGRSSRAFAFVVGIDLGTTNSALAYALATGGLIRGLPVPQLVGDGEIAPRSALPSAVYRPGPQDARAAGRGLPFGEPADDLVVGEWARTLGERLPEHLVLSAKSWLCHPGVDRRSRLLPWGSSEITKLSPVDVSTRILAHLAAAWRFEHPDAPLEQLPVVLTVPASFDEVARELTVEAARQAGLQNVRLLEEPQAALYAWVAAHPDWQQRLAGVAQILVLDIGGGTTDFSEIAVRETNSGLSLERVAVGEHLLLGGDNMDLALARLAVEQAGSPRLEAGQWRQLTALCRAAKERLLADGGPDEIPVALAGRGRSLLASTVRVALRAADALVAIRDGFLPMVEAEDFPGRGSEAGLAEIGLPYESDPAITRHLAAFLSKAGQGWPDAVLFNGGALEPASLRTRLLDVLEAWSGRRPRELEGADLAGAVSRGAAAYGLALRGHLPRISGGAARAYYIGLGGDPVLAVCVAPRGLEEGTSIELDAPALEIVSNEPVRFPLFASTTRLGDRAGDLVEPRPGEMAALPPLSAVLRFGRKLESRRIPVRLHAESTEVGTLDLSLVSRLSEHRWRLSFDLRAREGEVVAESESDDDGAAAAGGGSRDRAEALADTASLEAAKTALRGVFTGEADPVGLVRELEMHLGGGRDGWGITTVRALFDLLFEFESSRSRMALLEARWLNLAGFLLRPGYGEERDTFRIERLWKLYATGLAHPSAAQVRSEWWGLWRRVAGGLGRAEQQVMAQELRPTLLGKTRSKGRSPRWKAGPHEAREMWLVIAALERLPQALRQEFFDCLAPRLLKPGRASDAEVTAWGRLAARQLVAGPADVVLSPAIVAPWVEKLLAIDWDRPAAYALALASASRRLGDVAMDLPAGLRERVATRLAGEAAGRVLARWPLEIAPFDSALRALVLAESLPVGLHLAAEA